MTKKHKQSSSNEAASSFGSMGRVLFFSLALVIACCAVAVVLFETEAGQEFVAKVRGDEWRHGQDETGSSPSSSGEKKKGDFEGQGSEAKTEKPANAEQESVTPDGDSPGSEKDTSSKVAEDFKEGDRTVEDTSRREGAASDEHKFEENTEEETFMNERETSHEVERNMENGEKVDDEPAVGDVSGSEDSKVEEEEDEEIRKTWEDIEESNEEDNAGNSDSDAETFDAKEHVDDSPQDSEPIKESSIEDESVEEQAFVEETPKQDIELQQNEEAPLDNISEEQTQEDTFSVGDSLTSLEEERADDMRQTEDEENSWEPLAEPEGPPIDEYPRHARRGLRGDYGSKDCNDTHVNCKAWADIGECKKNPIWMEVKCKKSCDVCSCSDNNLKCSEWLKAGECDKNYNYMNENCMKSCGRC